MGLLTRQENENWIIEIKEKFFCPSKEEAKEVQDFLLSLRITHTVAVENYFANDFYTFAINNEMVTTHRFDDCLEYHKQIMIMKSRFGQRPKKAED
jgi:hypothetical protein